MKLESWFHSALAFLAVMVLGFCSSPGDWVDSLPPPWTLSEAEVSNLLPRFKQRYPDFHQRLKAFARWRLGTPYGLFKLGEEVAPDPDPILRLDLSDCTTHVLTTLACVQSDSWDQAREKMIRIHYKTAANDRHYPTYRSRWHFTSDRVFFNPSTPDLTSRLLPAEDLEMVTVTLNRKADGQELLDLDWSREVTIGYIPNSGINRNLLSRFPEVCGVAFVKKSQLDLGLLIAHEGMLIDRRALIHASAEYGETVQVDFLEYFFRPEGPLFDGILVYEFVPL